VTATRVLVITTDPLTERMPGPAIRAWHLGEVLSRDHQVTLVSSVACDRTHPAMDVRSGDDAEVGRLAAEAEVVVGPGSVVRRYPAVAGSTTPLVIDLYDPYHLENLEPDGTADLPGRARNLAHLNSVVGEDLARGDFFVCASTRQRDFWLGSLAAAGRVNPYTYDDDPRLDRLISVVPFGLPSAPPRRQGPGLRERFEGIGPTDRVVVWGGGVYNWFDPSSLVRAVARARAEIPDLRLVFLGMRNPNPHIPEMRVATEIRHLAADLGLAGTNVFFNEGWVPYEQRGDSLLDAQLGVSTSFDHVESRFSFRTRVLDYLWAGLPMILTEGDVLAETVAGAGAGVTVAAGDVEAIADALVQLLDHPLDRDNVRRLAARFHWDRVAVPLAEFCAHPYRAPDLLAAPSGRPRSPVDQPAVEQPPPAAKLTPPTANPTLLGSLRHAGGAARRRLRRT
jgi:glycosyltransferase involved in cell wall biosynthesis